MLFFSFLLMFDLRCIIKLAKKMTDDMIILYGNYFALH